MSKLKEKIKNDLGYKEKPFQPAESNPMFDIIFINDEGHEDETEFTVEGTHSLEECAEILEELFDDFCKENGFDNNKVVKVIYQGPDPYYITQE